ncbi:putative ankyrin repeat domain-containing protein 40 isoform [Sesbania bispinosa]|nr:putative ankyrin repeat domain-containing protein 40 isoform [Sesbania bispinosa]
MTAHGMHSTTHQLTQCRRQQRAQRTRRCSTTNAQYSRGCSATQQPEQLASFTKNTLTSAPKNSSIDTGTIRGKSR